MQPDFVEAVTAVASNLGRAHRRVLEEILRAPDHSASAGELKTLLGLKAVVQVNNAMGYVGRKVYKVLGSHPDGWVEGEDPFEWWTVIATGQTLKGRGFVWQLRAEVVTALTACGFAALREGLLGELPGSAALFEGAVHQRMVNVYERNSVAQRKCIEVHGYRCMVCHFDFGAVYGEAAKGFIHVHHLRPLAFIGQRYEVNPVDDLRPVCPNCHAVIHLSEPPLSIQEVQAMLRAKPPRGQGQTSSSDKD